MRERVSVTRRDGKQGEGEKKEGGMPNKEIATQRRTRTRKEKHVRSRSRRVNAGDRRPRVKEGKKGK